MFFLIFMNLIGNYMPVDRKNNPPVNRHMTPMVNMLISCVIFYTFVMKCATEQCRIEVY